MHCACQKPVIVSGQNLRGEARIYRAIDEDPQTFASNSLQMLPIVQLSQDNFILHDVVLQDNLEQPLVLGHDVIWRVNSGFTGITVPFLALLHVLSLSSRSSYIYIFYIKLQSDFTNPQIPIPLSGNVSGAIMINVQEVGKRLTCMVQRSDLPLKAMLRGASKV